jgi:hypothetical protein
LKIILNSYAKSVVSSRGMETLCRENVLFIAISGDNTPDNTTIATFISRMENEIIEIYRQVLLICAQLDLVGGEIFALDGYIPDHGFRTRDPRYPERKEERKKRVKYHQEDFSYNEKDGCYYCPMGKRLTRKRRNILFHGYRGDRYAASILDCRACVNHYRCLNSQAKFKALFVTIKPKKKTWSVKMMEKIDTEHGRDMYAKLMGIVEPVFAHIIYQKKLNRFTLRGLAKVKIQWLLFMPMHNIQKINRYGKGEIKKIVNWQPG